MASIYLVNALYGNKPDTRKTKPEPLAAERTQPITTVEHPNTDIEMSCRDSAMLDHDVKDETPRESTATEQPATMHSAIGEQSKSEIRQLSVGSDGMHPARQHVINLKGPLEEMSEPVIISCSGANRLALGQKSETNASSRNLPIISKKLKVGPPLESKAAKKRATRARMQAEADVRARDQLLRAMALPPPINMRMESQAIDSNTTYQAAGRRNAVNSALDPRLHPRPEENRSDGFAGIQIKREEDPSDCLLAMPVFERPDSEALPANQHSSLASRPALHVTQHLQSVQRPNEKSAGLSQQLPVLGVDAESRIRDLEEENLALRKIIFNKDRDIRKLVADRNGMGNEHDCRPGIKRARFDGEASLLVRY